MGNKLQAVILFVFIASLASSCGDSQATPLVRPTPTVCNSSWRDPKALHVRVASSPDEARQVLQNELKRWTRVEALPRDRSAVRLYLTYLSPQVIEAVISEKAAREKLSPEESRELLAEFDRRLQRKNAIPFLLTIRGTKDPGLQIALGQLEKTMVLVNQRQQKIPPVIEYTPALAAPINMANGGIEGYVLFPRSTGAGCHPTVNLTDDHSFDLRLSGVSISGVEPGNWLRGPTPYSYKDLQPLWSYTLLPDIGLEEAMNVPPPQRATEDLDISLLLDIVGLTISIVDMFLK